MYVTDFFEKNGLLVVADSYSTRPSAIGSKDTENLLFSKLINMQKITIHLSICLVFN
jgi:hypothetical protein